MPVRVTVQLIAFGAAPALQLALAPVAGAPPLVLQVRLAPRWVVQLNVVLPLLLVLNVQLRSGVPEKCIQVPSPCTRLTTAALPNGVAVAATAAGITLSGNKAVRPPCPEWRVFSMMVCAVVSTTRWPPVSVQRKMSSECIAAQFR